jgi:hypothetical protein
MSEKDSGVQISRYWVRVRGFREAGLKRAIDNGLGPALAAPAYGPGTEGAGTRVCGYAIKNSGLTVAVNRQHLHVCVKEPRVKIRISGVARTGQDGRGPYRNTGAVSSVACTRPRLFVSSEHTPMCVRLCPGEDQRG